MTQINVNDTSINKLNNEIDLDNIRPSLISSNTEINNKCNTNINCCHNLIVNNEKENLIKMSEPASVKLSFEDLGQNKEYLRTLQFVVKLKDVPFINQTRVIKSQKLIREGEKLICSSSSVNLDAPYCSYFSNEDTWEILPRDNDKCVLRYLIKFFLFTFRICCYVNFNKSTVFKSKIEKKAKEEYNKEYSTWLEYLTKNGIKHEAYNASKPKKKEEKTLQHGIQKIEDLNKKNITVFKKFKNYVRYGNNLRVNNPIQFYLYIYLTLVIILLLAIIFNLHSLNNKYEKLVKNKNNEIQSLVKLIKRDYDDIINSCNIQNGDYSTYGCGQVNNKENK